MESSQSVDLKAVTIKRIYKDLAEIEKEPIDGVSVCMPNPENPFLLISNVLILNEPYAGMIIPLKLKVPQNYPFSPPEVRIVPGIKFNREFHGHIFDDPTNGNTICVDILSNYQTHFQGVDYGNIGTLKRVSGWTPGYSLTSILIQMQVFFTEHDLSKESLPSAQRIKKFKEDLSKFSYTIDGPCGAKIIHSTEKPYPPIALSKATREVYGATSDNITGGQFLSLETSKQEIKYGNIKTSEDERVEAGQLKAMSNTEFAKRVMCTLTRVNYLDNPETCYGVPIHVTIDKFKRAWTVPVTEIISEDAYRAQLQKISSNQAVLSRELVSGWGQPFTIWLPIFLSKEHLKKSKDSIVESLKIMSFGNEHKNYKFDSTRAVNAICTILNKLVINLLKGTLIQSVASVEIYCQILLLLVKLQKVFPEIPVYIEKRINDMLKNEKNRNKQNLGDIGEFLVMLALSKYGLTDTRINDTLLEEYSARQVMWVLKDFPDIVYRTNGRAKNYFKSSLVSHQLFVFNVEAAKTFIIPDMLEKLEKNCGLPDEKTMSTFLNRIDWVKENVNSFKVFFECIGMNEKINASSEKDMHEYLDRACKISCSQGYTTKPK